MAFVRCLALLRLPAKGASLCEAIPEGITGGDGAIEPFTITLREVGL